MNVFPCHRQGVWQCEWHDDCAANFHAANVWHRIRGARRPTTQRRRCGSSRRSKRQIRCHEPDKLPHRHVNDIIGYYYYYYLNSYRICQPPQNIDIDTSCTFPPPRGDESRHCCWRRGEWRLGRFGCFLLLRLLQPSTPVHALEYAFRI